LPAFSSGVILAPPYRINDKVFGLGAFYIFVLSRLAA